MVFKAPGLLPWLALCVLGCGESEPRSRSHSQAQAQAHAHAHAHAQGAAPRAAPAESRAPSHEREARPGDPRVRGRIGELAGTWHGQANVPEHGLVSATLYVTSGGLVLYTAIARGHALSGQLAIAGWDGRTLRLMRDAATYEVAAELTGDALVAMVPGIGAVRLAREARR